MSNLETKQALMPSKKNQPKKDNTQKPKGGKRKNISPLFTDNTHSTTHTDYTDKTGFPTFSQEGDQSDSGNNTVSSENKRFHPSSPEYFLFDLNSMAMNCQPQYGGQFVQSSPYTQQFSTVPPAISPNSQNSQPPPWITVIMDDIKSIKTSVAKIETIEKTVNIINLKMNELESKIQTIEHRVTDVEKATTFINEQYETQSNVIKATKDEVKCLEKSCNILKNNMQTLEKEKQSMNSKILDLEYRSMKENLIFYGIPESPVTIEEGEESSMFKNCEKLVKKFIKDKIKIDADHMIFDRAHRLGDITKSKKPRPIIVKFHYFNERERIRTTAYKARDELKSTNHGVGVQLPKEWRDARNNLYHVLQSERRKGKTAKFIGEKLYIDGEEYKPLTTTT